MISLLESMSVSCSKTMALEAFARMMAALCTAGTACMHAVQSAGMLREECPAPSWAHLCTHTPWRSLWAAPFWGHCSSVSCSLAVLRWCLVDLLQLTQQSRDFQQMQSMHHYPPSCNAKGSCTCVAGASTVPADACQA